MYYVQRNFEADAEILASEKSVVAFTGTVKSEGVEADDFAKKFVPKGTLIDAEGGIVTATAEGALSGTPAGILLDTVDVTYGDATAAPLLVGGWVVKERVKLGDGIEYSDKVGGAIKKALPEIVLV